MKKIILVYLVLLYSLKGFSQFTNVLISSSNTPNEPAIAIDPNNTNLLIAATNTTNYYISSDGGVSWSENTASSTLGVYGDFSLLVDNNSNLYMFHLSNPNSGNWLDRIVCQKSTDVGATFNDGSYFGLNGTKDQDKEWIQIDRGNGNIYATWTEFDLYGSSNSSYKTRILFTKSTDDGTSWSSPVKINTVDGDCIDSDNTVEGAVPAVGPNGEIYTSWSGPAGIRFNKSTDYGETWLETPILVDTQPTGWDYAIPGIYRGNGLPITVCDTSEGPYNGTIYVNWSDQRNGSDDTDIWLKKSTDGGVTWSDLIRVNDDEPGHQQFFTWMSIDQTSGYLYIVFYDRRNYTDTMTDVFLARSTDGGATFTNYKISDTAFVPNEGVFFGDYTNIAAHNGIIRPIWTSLNNGNLKVWTALINENQLGNEQYQQENIQLSQNFPNPALEETYISFKVKKNTNISLKITDIQGRIVAKPIDHETYTLGKYIIRIPLQEYHLKNGIYYYTLTDKTTSFTKKMILSNTSF